MTPQWLTIFIQILIFIIGGVMAVNAIRTTTAVLNETIKSLKLSIDTLRITIKEIQDELWEHKAKIAVLESKQG